MEEKNSKEYSKPIFTRAVKAGNRIYFFDVKTTANDKPYITITESKRKIEASTGKYIYEKHKLYLYKEDFEKFANGLSDAIDFIETGEERPLREENIPEEEHVDFSFEDLSVTS